MREQLEFYFDEVFWQIQKRKAKKIVYEDEEVVFEPGSTSNKKNVDNLNFVDDDDLQSALSRIRKTENKRVWSNPEHLAQRIRQQNDSDEEKGGIIISELSEFVGNLSVPEEILNEFDGVPMEDQDGVPMEQDEKNPSVNDGEINEAEMATESDQIEPEPIFLTEEPIVADGLAATLQFLSRKGDLETITEEHRAREALVLEREKWMRHKKLQEALGNQLSKADKRIEAKLAKEKFKNYKPDINLTYRDESGRVLSTKEAYKELSHKFHGKYSGKNKKEKQLRKLQQELAMKSLNSDVPMERIQTIAKPEMEILGVQEDEPIEQQEVVRKEDSNENLTIEETMTPSITKAPIVAPAVQSNRSKISFGLSLKKKTLNRPSLD